MDSEHRHELEENALAKTLRQAPEYFREYGAYLVLGLAMILAVAWVYRSRVDSARAEQQATAQGLYNMVTLVGEAEQLASMAPVMSPSQLQEQRTNLDAQFKQFSPLVADSSNPGTVAHGLRLRGDFAWAMGTMPEPLGEEPTTNPADSDDASATAPESGDDVASLLNEGQDPATTPPDAGEDRSPQEWLDEAAAAYQQVLDRYADHTRDVLAARLGLAAIHEQRGEFDVAREQYQALLESEESPGSLRNLARERQNLLNYLAMNVRLAAPATRPAEEVAPGDIGLPPLDPTAPPATPTTPPTTPPAVPPVTPPTPSPDGN